MNNVEYSINDLLDSSMCDLVDNSVKRKYE